MRSITRDGERLRVQGEGGVELECDQVIMAAPAFRAAEIVRDLEPELSRHLEEIPFVNVAVVNIEFRGRVLDHQVTIIISDAGGDHLTIRDSGSWCRAASLTPSLAASMTAAHFPRGTEPCSQ